VLIEEILSRKTSLEVPSHSTLFRAAAEFLQLLREMKKIRRDEKFLTMSLWKINFMVLIEENLVAILRYFFRKTSLGVPSQSTFFRAADFLQLLLEMKKI
jgi:hypothetical protein